MSNDLSLLSPAAKNLLAKVQSIFGAGKVTVTSTGRTAGANAGIAGASKTSQHILGADGLSDAFDFTVAGMSPDQVQRMVASSGLSFGQSIQEYGAGMGPRNHLGVGTKGQLLTATNGKYSTIGYAPASNAGDPGAGVGGYGRTFLKGIFGDAWGNALSDGGYETGALLAAPGDGIDKMFGGLTLSGWFTRITFGVFAILLIAVALFMLSGVSAKDVVSKVPPIPV